MSNKLYEEISDEELDALTNAIKNRYGLDFTNYEKKSLKRGFSRLMSKNGMGSLLKLWNTILRDTEFFKGCIDDLTVNLTELFRNPEIWGAIDQTILPRFKNNGRINVWHAGCSTGEEVYSMAMVADQKGLLHRTKLLGTDISSTALAKAVKGKYSKALVDKYERSLKKYSDLHSMKDLFYLDDEGNASIKQRYKSAIGFQPHNLVIDPAPGKFDIIFCRNVMIYFDDRLKFKVTQKLLKALNPNGVLILGYYDMLPESCRSLVKELDSSNRIYLPAAADRELVLN